MRIEKIDLLRVRLPMLRPFAISSGHQDYQEHILLKLYADGLVGWGECPSPLEPYYCEEYADTCWVTLKEILLPKVLGKSWETIEELTSYYAEVKRNYFAKAGLELACWDVLARARNQPLHRLLGGTRKEILSGVSLGIQENSNKLLELIGKYYQDQGYRRVKLKVAPGKDLDVLAWVRGHYPDIPLQVDANAAYRLSDFDHLREFDQFNLTMIEQPLAHDDILDHAALQEKLKTPICLDESIISVNHVRQAIQMKSCQIVNIKAARVGGLLEAKRVHDYCHARGIPVWCGGMLEFGIGRAANAALASLPGFSLPADCTGFDVLFSEDIVNPPFRAVKGAIQLPETPGLGYRPDEDRIRKYTVTSLSK